MVEYDNLVKQLRYCATTPTCRGCMWIGERCLTQMKQQAADAIEELSKDLERSKEYEALWEDLANEALKKFQFAIASKPRWISVEEEENLPNTDSGVVGYFGGGSFNQLRWYDFITTLSDGTIVSENTERDVTNEHCIAVYKLPEPPKKSLEKVEPPKEEE